MSGSRWVALALACLFGAQPALGATACGTDVDCPGEQVCEAGTCVNPGGAPAAAPAAKAPAEPPKRRTRSGLLVAGGVTFLAGYLVAVAVTIAANAYVGAHPSNECWTAVAHSAFIPIAGPILSIVAQSGLHSGSFGSSCTSQDEFAPGLALAIVDAAAQITGVILFGLGLIPHTPEAEDSKPTAQGPQLQLLPGAPGALAGLSVRLVNW